MTDFRELIDAARQGQETLAAAWIEMGREAANQMRDANRRAIFESRMDHIDAMIAELIERRETLEAKILEAPPTLERVYRAHASAIDAELERYALQAESTAEEMRGDSPDVKALKADDEAGGEKLYKRTGRRFVPAQADSE